MGYNHTSEEQMTEWENLKLTEDEAFTREYEELEIENELIAA